MYSLTPGSLTIPIADVSGHLDGWVSHAATVLVHEERFTAGTYYTATAPQVLVGFTTSISSYSVSASAVVANGSSMACDAFLAIKNGSTTLAVRHGGVNPGYNTNLSVTELATVTPGTDITLYFYSNSASCTVNVSAGDANMVAIPATPF
jgi:hypothetical protein